MTITRDSLIERVQTLHSSLHQGKLSADDLISFDELKSDSTEDYISTNHNNKSEFDNVLSGFAETYDIFRIFDDDVLVLDVGAHWGYSVSAMRHQGCRAKIVSIEALELSKPALEKLKTIEMDDNDYFIMVANDLNCELQFYIASVNGFASTRLASTGGAHDKYFAHLVADLVNLYPAAATDIRLAEFKVKAAPIDWIVEPEIKDKRPIATMKVDVEGHEAEALAAAKEIFLNHKPILMLVNANRDPDAVAIMLSYDYFHAEHHGDTLSAHTEFSYADDGFWISRDRVEDYRKKGLFEGAVPTANQASKAVKAKWNAKEGFIS